MEEKDIQKSADTVKADNEKVETTGKPTFTEEQQKYIDGLIDKQYAKLQAKAEEKQKEIEQAEKLKSMSEVDRLKAEQKILQEKLQKYESEKLINQFRVELTTKGLKPEFADFLAVNDADKAKQAVDFLANFKDEIVKEYEVKIKELEDNVRKITLRGTPPVVAGDSGTKAESTPTVF